MKIGKINRQSIGTSGFTSVLKHIAQPPQQLFIAGSLPANRPPVVAIIGSRRPTAYGKEVTDQLARALARRGVVIISGLAYGIDAIAHEAALAAGGTTIAVLANGLHRIYPAAHTGLAERIVQQGGALISEKELGYDARKHDFLARNRLVSGLADAIIVTEATERSGTISTVTHALEQNKEVFAVPGPITSLLSVGPNKLLQQGAHPALEAQDILNIIAPQLQPVQTVLPIGMNSTEQAIIAALAKESTTLDALAVLSQDTSLLLQSLTSLELRGSITSKDGYWYLKK